MITTFPLEDGETNAIWATKNMVGVIKVETLVIIVMIKGIIIVVRAS